MDLSSCTNNWCNGPLSVKIKNM